MYYKYITENNLEHKQNYMYSEYGGYKFLLEYEAIRKDFIERYPTKKYNMTKLLNENMKTSKELSDIYYHLCREDIKDYSRLDGYLKSFEVRKRLYDCYEGDSFRPICDENYKEVYNYILLSVCLCLAYKKTNCLKYYNAMLKVDDTLMSLEKIMSDEECYAVSFCIEKELSFYYELSKTIMEES